MSDSLGFADAASRSHTIAAALALGCSLDTWSLTFVILALAGLLWLSLPLLPTVCLFVSLLAGCAQKIYALRVAFDAAIFRRWAETWRSAAAQDRVPVALEPDLAALDQALTACGLRAPAGGAVRDLDSRLRGAGKLLWRQALSLAIQFVMMAAAAAMLQPLAG